MVFIGIISGFAPLRERDRDINEFVFLEVNYLQSFKFWDFELKGDHCRAVGALLVIGVSPWD